jgi:heat shock protein HtpX
MAIDFVGLITLYALSREREYLADATAVKLTRYPQALISALKKISKNSKMEVPAGVSHLFIDEPLEGFMASLFSTHPPIEKRIERLKQLI